jgi:hypothetical protein
MRTYQRLLQTGLAGCLLLACGLHLARASDEVSVDLVHLRLFRNEIRRWMREGAIPDEDSFEDWAFGGEDGEKRFRDQLDDLLDSKLQAVDRATRLTASQRRKLRLAGRGDIKRLLDLIDDARTEFERASADLRRLPDLQTRLLLVDLRVSKGLFEAGSITAKTLRKMADEQAHSSRLSDTTR